MTDTVMMELAKMQTKIRTYENNEKKHIEQLHLRDDEISRLNKELDLLKLKDQMIAKNQSYLEAKVQKDVAHSDIIQSSGMKLKEVADWLRRDHSLTASEKFELYYEEHLRLKEEKGLKDINALLDSVGIDKNNRGKKNGS